MTWEPGSDPRLVTEAGRLWPLMTFIVAVHAVVIALAIWEAVGH